METAAIRACFESLSISEFNIKNRLLIFIEEKCALDLTKASHSLILICNQKRNSQNKFNFLPTEIAAGHPVQCKGIHQ